MVKRMWELCQQLYSYQLPKCTTTLYLQVRGTIQTQACYSTSPLCLKSNGSVITWQATWVIFVQRISQHRWILQRMLRKKKWKYVSNTKVYLNLIYINLKRGENINFGRFHHQSAKQRKRHFNKCACPYTQHTAAINCSFSTEAASLSPKQSAQCAQVHNVTAPFLHQCLCLHCRSEEIVWRYQKQSSEVNKTLICKKYA